MQILVLGATGGTGRLLAERLLADGHDVRALARDPGRGAPLADQGAEVVLGDLTDPDPSALHVATAGTDVVAFCVGSGSATGKDQTLLVDLHGAVRSIDAAIAAGTRRYLMLSSISADDPWKRGADAAPMAPYYAAKHAADRILAASDLEWTIVRPGRLTDDAGTDHVHVGQPIPSDRYGERRIARADVAAVMAGCLTEPATARTTFEVLRGDTPLAEALASLTPGVPPS